MTITNIGSVRGSCGHKHRTESGALRCLHADQRECRSQGGYSDRYPVRSDGVGGHDGSNDFGPLIDWDDDHCELGMQS